MKTVHDLIRHGSTLQVICTNCSNTGVLNHRFLVHNFGGGMVIAKLRFVCRRCDSRRYRVRFVSKHLGEAPPLQMQWFKGAYEKAVD